METVMIRTTKHILKWNNEVKDLMLEQIFMDYSNCLKYYIHLITSEQLPSTKMLSTKLLPTYSGIIHTSWKNDIYRQAQVMISNEVNKISKKRYSRYQKVYFYFKKKNRQLAFLDKRFKELKLKSLYPLVNIDIKEISPLLDFHQFNITRDSKGFDEFIRITTPYLKPCTKTRYITINLPFKHHKHSNKYLTWNRRKTIQLKKINDNFYINLFYEKSEPIKVTEGKTIGIDIGYKKLISTSENQHLGQEMEYVYKKISQKKQGSKAFNRALIERNNLTNYYTKQLITDNLKEIIAEDLKDVKKGSKFSKKFNNKLQRWSYSKVLNRLQQLSEEKGFLLTKVNPAYTSQICSHCGTQDKSARNGEIYTCKVCGISIDADYNASINILHRGIIFDSSTKENLNNLV